MVDCEKLRDTEPEIDRNLRKQERQICECNVEEMLLPGSQPFKLHYTKCVLYTPV